MNLVSKLFNYVSTEERKGISLDEDTAWKVAVVKDMPSFLRSLIDLVPDDSILYLEGGNPPLEIKRYLEKEKADKIAKIAMGTIWPRPKCYHMKITPENMEGLAQLTEKIATPEAAIHLHVYKENTVLLQWYDAFDDPMYVSNTIPEGKLKNFCEKLGTKYSSDHRGKTRSF